MLIEVKSLTGYTLESHDGTIGHIKEFVFDDLHWTVRYLVADAGSGLTARKLLISPYSLAGIIKEERKIRVSLTRKQLEESPRLGRGKPITRPYEEMYHTYFAYPRYWNGPHMWGAYPAILRDRSAWKTYAHSKQIRDSALHSTLDANGWQLSGADGVIGHVDDFIIEEDNWSLAYFVVAVGSWWPGKKVLVSTQWIGRVRWEDSKIFLNLSREMIKKAPEYTEELLVKRDDENRLHHHYNRTGYWIGDTASETSSP